MSSSQTALNSAPPTLPRRIRNSLLHPFRVLKRFLPRRLFGRSLIIVLAPMLILLTIVTAVFFDRHYRIVTATLTRGVANDIGYMVQLENSAPLGPARDAERQRAAAFFNMPVQFLPDEKLDRSISEPADPLDRQLFYIFRTQLRGETSFDTQSYADYVDVRVQLKDGVLSVLVPRARVAAANADIFILWMIGSSLVLIVVAVLFLRNQVKPIEQLALAAERFGKGRSAPDFKPYGAAEVRRAAHAFIAMRERIERHVQQRTEMLAGVSHDLKTPLTRMRLQLAMMPKDTDHDAMAADVAEMDRMVNEYLEFARGESGEDAAPTDLAALLQEAVQDSGRARGGAAARIRIAARDAATVSVKKNTLKRCLVNLIDNALKYGRHVDVALRRSARAVEISVDDDGPGISEHRREEAFRPFHRLDEGRNLQTGGVGLGLAVARDIARAHGGDVLLEHSALGGLRAVIRLPI